MTKEEFKIALSQGYVGDNESLERKLSELADYVWENKKRPVKFLTAAVTLTEEDCGKLLVFNAAEGKALALPPVATSAGFHYKFVTGLAFATSAWTVVAATAKIQGGVIVNSVLVPAANITTITVAHAAETVGDTFELDCDGVNWYLNGVAKAAGGITVA